MTGHVRVTFFAGLATLLAAMSLTPVFKGAAWFWPTIGALLLLGGSGALLRRRPVTAGLVPVAQAGIVLLWLTWLYAENAAGGLLPGPGALGDFGDLISTGADDAALYSPPVPESHGLEFMTVLGISVVAIVVDALAATFHRAALAGLPLLALYTVPASVLSGGLNVMYFVLAAIGYIGLLIAEGRDKVSRWGRPLIASASIGRGTARAAAPVETSSFAQVGRRIGAAVIGLAVVVPAALPLTGNAMFRGDDGLFGGGGGGGDGDDATVIDPVVSLRRDFFDREERTVMIVNTDDPRAAGTYYRMATLGEFDGEEWRRSEPATEDVSPDTIRIPIGLAEDVPRTEVHSRIETTEFLQSDHLPVPYPLTGLEIDGSWRIDLPTGNILSARGARQLAEIEYGTTSLSLNPEPEQLAAAGTAAQDYAYYLEVPEDLPPIVREMAQEVTAGSKSAWDRALRLQDWFTDPQNFTYDTSSNHDGWGSTAIEQFLTGRRGYCEQFAATMAVMARLLNIPSRVNIGFTGGERLDDGRYEVTTKDLHAWPELYFDGIGWLRFEPTPISTEEGRGSTPVYAQAATQDEALPDDGGPTGPDPTASTQPSAGPGAEAFPDEASCSGLPPQQLRECIAIVRSQTTPSGPADDPLLPPWAIAGGALILLGLITPASVRVAIRRRRYRAAGRQPAAMADAGWSELRDSAVDLGYRWPSSETPRQTAARLTKDAKLRNRHVEALSRLTTAIERARYAPTVAPIPGAAKDVRTVREGLAARVGRSRRFRAWALPASTITVAHWLGERFADVLDWIDRLGSGLRTRFRMKGTFAR